MVSRRTKEKANENSQKSGVRRKSRRFPLATEFWPVTLPLQLGFLIDISQPSWYQHPSKGNAAALKKRPRPIEVAKLNIDERLEKLIERHEALTHSIELMQIEMRETDKRVAERIEGLTSVTASLALTAQAQQASIEELRTQWRETLAPSYCLLSGMSA